MLYDAKLSCCGVDGIIAVAIVVSSNDDVVVDASWYRLGNRLASFCLRSLSIIHIRSLPD